MTPTRRYVWPYPAAIDVAKAPPIEPEAGHRPELMACCWRGTTSMSMFGTAA
jgi:hypothetical protein